MLDQLLPWLPLLFLGVGILVGIVILMLDEKVVYRYYYRYLYDPEKPDKPTTVITRSFLFVLIYWPMAMYILSTSSTTFAQGLVLGIGLKLGLDLWFSHKDVETMKQVFVIPSNSKITATEVSIFTYVWWVLLVIATIYAIV